MKVKTDERPLEAWENCGKESYPFKLFSYSKQAAIVQKLSYLLSPLAFLPLCTPSLSQQPVTCGRSISTCTCTAGCLNVRTATVWRFCCSQYSCNCCLNGVMFVYLVHVTGRTEQEGHHSNSWACTEIECFQKVSIYRSYIYTARQKNVYVSILHHGKPTAGWSGRFFFYFNQFLTPSLAKKLFSVDRRLWYSL